jgi:hypothetical protein
MRDYDVPWTWSEHYYGLIEEGLRQDDCLAVCVAHQGRHPYLDGGCHELAKPLPRLERVRIANLDRPQPAPPVRVEFDPDDLAEVLKRAAVSMKPTASLPVPAPAKKTPVEPASGQQQPPTPTRRILEMDEDV